MSDASVTPEPSMDEILQKIQRIIAEDEKPESAPAPTPPRSAEILTLTEAVGEAELARRLYEAGVEYGGWRTGRPTSCIISALSARAAAGQQTGSANPPIDNQPLSSPTAASIAGGQRALFGVFRITVFDGRFSD